MSAATSHTTTRGVLFVHGTPAALCPHIGWAVEAVLERAVTLDWVAQPVQPRMVRTELMWTGPVGTGAGLASALRGWHGLRYEVTEEASPVSDGSRWTYTPSLGIHHAWMSVSGDVVVNEDRLREAIARNAGDPEGLRHEIDLLLGSPWDAELEPFRYAGEGASVRWLHKVG
ncbi:DUF3145 domain-containing protein [Intrasporangium sp.]|uniref:DUF3145 domain-containing protein n=1 Tax=Intrasporangium sp. TaxID=1925024 RepID=UPI00322194D2